MNKSCLAAAFCAFASGIMLANAGWLFLSVVARGGHDAYSLVWLVAAGWGFGAVALDFASEDKNGARPEGRDRVRVCGLRKDYAGVGRSVSAGHAFGVTLHVSEPVEAGSTPVRQHPS